LLSDTDGGDAAEPGDNYAARTCELIQHVAGWSGIDQWGRKHSIGP
jgi:hypothetical protein